MEVIQIYRLRLGLVKIKRFITIILYNSTRGTNKFLYISTADEGTNTYLTLFNSDGFSLNAMIMRLMEIVMIIFGIGNGKRMVEVEQHSLKAVTTF